MNKLAVIAKEIGCTLAQLAIAWITLNDKGSTVILGASRISQLDENLDALEFVDKITLEIRARIEAIVGVEYKQPEPETHLLAMRKRWL